MGRPEIQIHETDLHPAREAPNTWRSFLLLIFFFTAPAIAFVILANLSLPHPYPWWTSPLIFILITLLCGVFSGLMAPDVPIVDGNPKAFPLAGHILRYCVLQLIITPTIFIALFAAYWLIRLISEIWSLFF